MSTQAAPAAPAAEQAQEQGGIGSMFQQFIRMFLMYQLMGMGMRFFKGEGNSSGEGDGATAGSRTVGGVKAPPGVHANLWQNMQEFDLFVYLSEHEEFTPGETEGELVWQEEDLYYAWSKVGNERNKTITIPISTALQSNQSSLWAHVFATVSGSMDTAHGDVLYSKHAVVKKRKLKKMAELKSLFGEDSMAQAAAGILPEKQVEKEPEPEDGEEEDEPIINHFIPELPFVIVHDFQQFKPSQLPEALVRHFEFHEGKGYKPVHYVDNFWVLRRSWVPLNDTVTEVDLKLSFYITSFMRFQMITQMKDTWKKQAEMGMQEEHETDTIVTMIMDNNPFFLGLTMVVTMFHSLFDCLAFKNDVQFWQKTKNLEGLSIRTVFLNCFCQVVIFLYLVENDTSYMILISSFVGLFIEFWKVTKVSDVKFHTTGGRFGYWIEVTDKDSYTSDTKKYDAEATKYLSWAMYPLLFVYAVYSMFYKEHKGWYSFVLSTLVGFVYMFGFILMCPQLYINYKLQSVAHLPWRMLTYKFLNTIIDDLFAFLIEMPWLHRLSCFRDDAVFVVFLYQKWIYPTDMTRANEFGLVPQQEGEGEGGQPAAVDGSQQRATTTKAPELTGPAKDRASLVTDLTFLNQELKQWWEVAKRRKAPVDQLTDRMKKYSLEFEELQNQVKTIDWKHHLKGPLPKLLNTHDLNSGSNGDLSGTYNFVDEEQDPPLDATTSGVRQRNVKSGATFAERTGENQPKDSKKTS